MPIKRKRKPKKKPYIPVIWSKSRCRYEAKKYKWYSDFTKYSREAYRAAKRNGWVGEYTWLIHGKARGWTPETVMEEAKKYGSSTEFHEKCPKGWRYAYNHGLLKDMTWFIKATPELRDFMSKLFGKVYNLLIAVGVEKTREWLFIESGKQDIYSKDECTVMRMWSERVNEKWASWKKYKWWAYEDMDYRKRRKKGDSEMDMDDGLHLID